jgi:drug/metabolite transporter (DMT)-like permease
VKQTCWTNRVKAIVFINTYNFTLILYQSLAKMITNSGCDVIDLCFIRTTINFVIALFVVIGTKQDVIDIPKEHRSLLALRCIVGLIGFTCNVYTVSLIPLFLTSIIFNTSPFWTSIMQYCTAGVSISYSEMIGMLGCFGGVIVLSLAKNADIHIEISELSDEPDGFFDIGH